MSTPPNPPLEGQPGTDGPEPAEPTELRTTEGEPKGVAEGVPIAVLPNTPRGDGRYPVAWLHIVAPGRATPTATSRCECGRDRSAVGHTRVHALIADHTAHRDACPLRTTSEGRAAA